MNDARAACQSSMHLALLFAIALSAGYSDAFAQQPLAIEQVVTLLKDVKEADIKEHIEQYKVSFELTRENISTLIRAGASDGLLDTIEANLFAELVITSPHNGANCGATLRVEGRSVNVAERHLWLFAHRQGLGLWWPQVGEVHVNEDGSWKQSVFLGQPQDIGFDFEITALWVNSGENRDLNAYLERGEKEGFPGRQLPEGSPRATITCHKVSH